MFLLIYVLDSVSFVMFVCLSLYSLLPYLWWIKLFIILTIAKRQSSEQQHKTSVTDEFVRTLTVGDVVAPHTSIKAGQRLDQLIVDHLEPNVTGYFDHRVVDHVQCTQRAVVRRCQLRTVDHWKHRTPARSLKRHFNASWKRSTMSMQVSK